MKDLTAKNITVNVQTLGECSLRCGDFSISDKNDRSSKTWLLLAYMIHSRDRSIPQEEMISLIWGDYDASTDPSNALKTILHRTRTTLDGLGVGMGKKLISCRQGSYTLGGAVHIHTDIDNFSALCKTASTSDDKTKKLDCYLKALSLYNGRFLAKLSTEMWVVRLSTYYHNIYKAALEEALKLLSEREMHKEIEVVCLRAIKVDPNLEAPYFQLMRSYISLGNCHSAVGIYKSLADMLYNQFGVLPSDEARALYREAVRTKNEGSLEMHELQEHLREHAAPPGALMCDYDFFKVVCHAESRSISRTGIAVHTALLSVENAHSGKVSRRSLEICMDNLDDVVRTSLRISDAAAKCSISQYAILLPQASFESATIALEKIVKNFYRKFPHSPATLAYSIYPLSPTV